MGYVGADADLCTALAREVDLVGGTAHLVADLNAARDTLTGLIRQYDVQTALCWQHPLLERLGLDGLLASLKVERVRYDTLQELDRPAQWSAMLGAEIGISSADYAVAETGSLALFSGPGHERAATLLPPVHVAVVERPQIVADLIVLFERLDPNDLASNIVLVTGPSKTGDIELQLTTGVHGPGKWHVIIIRESESA